MQLKRVAFETGADAFYHIISYLATTPLYGPRALQAMVPLVRTCVQQNSYACIGSEAGMAGVAAWRDGNRQQELGAYSQGRLPAQCDPAQPVDAAFMLLIQATDKGALNNLCTELKRRCLGKEIIWNRHKGAIRSQSPSDHAYNVDVLGTL